MSRYIITIHTDAYKPMKVTEKTWENGTVNDFMAALNGYKVTETNLNMVRRRIRLLQGCACPDYGEDVHTYFDWLNDPKSKARITFYDTFCKQERTHDVSVYGFSQGYLNVAKVIETLKTTGSVRIPFDALYDIRQSGSKLYKGCYMQIVKR